MEDMHIHLKEAIYNQELFDKYVRRCIECGLTKVVFLDHGNRISSKHTPVLFTQNSINSFNERIYEFRKSNMAEKIKVIKGIEIDYSHDLNFRKETFDILNYGNFEWIVGAIHSMKFENYKQYLEAIIDMLNNYRINVIAHIKKSDDYYKYTNMFVEILSICHEKNILIEINTSERSRWQENQLYYMLELMEKYGVDYVYSSDAHRYEDVGYMIKETEAMVRRWKKKR